MRKVEINSMTFLSVNPIRPSLAIIFALGLFSLAAEGQDCSQADILLSAQAEMNAFQSVYGPCTRVTGNLSIGGNDIIDISPLASLSEVGGELRIADSPGIENLNGLNTLQSVGGSFLLLHLDNLHNVDALSSLTTVGWLSLLTLPELSSLAGFDSLVTSTDGIAVAHLGGPIAIDGFNSLKSAREILIRDSLGIQSIGGFNQLTATEWDIKILRTAVDSIGGFNALLSARNVYVLQTDASVISGFTSLTEASLVEISDNPNLTEISGFGSLEALTSSSGDLRIQYNPSLSVLTGFSQLATISGDLVLSYLDELRDLSSLSNISAVGGDIQITNNPMLRALSWMGNLDFVEDELRINSNAGLRSLTGLENVQGVAGLMFVTFNPTLRDCTSIQPLIDEVDDYAPGPGAASHPDVGDLVLGGNANCNSVDQVLDQIFLDGLESY